MSSLQEIGSGSISQSSFNKLKHIKCIESIQFSTTHAVTAERKIKGDLFYLQVQTLENPSVVYGVTCTANGFFRNDSTNSAFSPLPSTKVDPCFSYTLVGCLYQMSATFGRNLETYFNSLLETETFFITPLLNTQNSWLDHGAAHAKITVSTSEQLGQTIVPLFGIDTK